MGKEKNIYKDIFKVENFFTIFSLAKKGLIGRLSAFSTVFLFLFFDYEYRMFISLFSYLFIIFLYLFYFKKRETEKNFNYFIFELSGIWLSVSSSLINYNITWISITFVIYLVFTGSGIFRKIKAKFEHSSIPCNAVLYYGLVGIIVSIITHVINAGYRVCPYFLFYLEKK